MSFEAPLRVNSSRGCSVIMSGDFCPIFLLFKNDTWNCACAGRWSTRGWSSKLSRLHRAPILFPSFFFLLEKGIHVPHLPIQTIPAKCARMKIPIMERRRQASLAHLHQGEVLLDWSAMVRGYSKIDWKLPKQQWTQRNCIFVEILYEYGQLRGEPSCFPLLALVHSISLAFSEDIKKY